ncbi:L-lactate dehydrogenase [Clostridium sp. DJ247]|uniref:L-lactate dehydrogenase n=1 Tax=Clostridium sp. DJ247 TaxID=2726188 RepID=UPI0016276FFE|nr:L-lactate dehydrogenase [Clostridium sp. DJ247]MBC2581999.1 L-lactate dehydrogenase [Clostridium sp. DJ247]
MFRTKISIIGAGLVGSSIAHTLMLSSIATDIVLVDMNMEKAEGEAMDLNHCVPSMMPVKVKAGKYCDCANSKMIIITAGTVQKPGESRLNLTQRNADIMKSIINEIKDYCKDSIILIVTNPVDILTFVTNKLIGMESRKIIGSGTILDTARFKFLISEYINVDSRNICAYVIGEHGDSSVPVWSAVNILGVDMENLLNKNHKIEKIRDIIHKEVVDSAYKIIEKKGSTYYGIAVAVRTIVETVVRNQNSVLTVSSYLTGQYGIKDVCISLPTIINSSGIEKVIDIPLDIHEIKKLQVSADSLKNIISSLSI